MTARPPISGSMSVAEAIRWMGWNRADAARWLAEEGLILVFDDGRRRRERVLLRDLEDRYRRVGGLVRPARRPAASRRPDPGRESDGEDMARWPRSITMGPVRARPKKGRGRRDTPDGPKVAEGRCVYWEARISTGGTRVTIWAGWATRANAERAVADAWRDFETAQEPDDLAGRRAVAPTYGRSRLGSDIRTVRELLDAWVDDCERMGLLRETTLREYRGRSKQVAQVIGELHPLEVSTRVLRGYVARRRQKVGEGTVRQDLMVLMAALRWARDTRRIDLVDLPSPPSIDYTPKRTSRAPDRRTLRLMFDALRNGVPAESNGGKPIAPCIDVAQALELQGRIGARTGELHGLRWRDVTNGPAGPCLRLDGKTDERYVPIVPGTQALLDTIRERLPGGPADRIITRRNYRGWVSLVYRKLRALPWDTWGVQRPKPNDFRADFSEAVLNSGATLAEFKALTGHSPETAVKHYHSATPQALAARMGRVDFEAALDVQILPLHRAKGDES